MNSYHLHNTDVGMYSFPLPGRFQASWQNCEKRPLASCPSVSPSLRVELGYHWTDFHEIWYLRSFQNHAEKAQVWNPTTITGTVHEGPYTFMICRSLFLCALLLTVVGLLCVVLLSCVSLCYLMCIVSLCVCIAVLHTLVAGLLARSQYPEGPATGHLGTGFSWFPCV